MPIDAPERILVAPLDHVNAMRTPSPDNFERVVSLPRLNNYKDYFKLDTMDEAIGLYLWNGEVSSCFASHLAYFEIAVRNSVHREMSLFYSKGESESCHWYDLIWKSLKQASRRKVDEVRERRHGSNLGPDEIVASLSFGFWPVVLHNVAAAHASRILPAVFPFHPLSASALLWSDVRTRRAALEFVFELHGFRNRLAHHEPLWKFRAIKDAKNPARIIEFASRSQADSIRRLKRLLGMLEDAIGYIDPVLQHELVQASWRQRLDFLLTERGIQRYRCRRHVPDTAVLTPAEFRYRFALIGRNNQPVRVRRARSSGLFVPD